MKSLATYSFDSVYRSSLQVNWKIEDILGGDKVLDFRRPFLPEALVGAEGLEFLAPTEQLVVNHIRAHSYLYLFGLVEEFIVPCVIDEARARIHKVDHVEIRALLHFAEEESKHIDLFKQFREEFHAGFHQECVVIGPVEAIAEQVLSKSTMGVLLTILHIEWATQRHYVESVRENVGLDHQFCSLLRYHWMEEAQHTKLDQLLIDSLTTHLSSQEIEHGIEDCLAISRLLDELFVQQVELDLQAVTMAMGRPLAEPEQQAYRIGQRQSYQNTFLLAGMTHPKFKDTVQALSAKGWDLVQLWVESLSSEDMPEENPVT